MLIYFLTNNLDTDWDYASARKDETAVVIRSTTPQDADMLADWFQSHNVCGKRDTKPVAHNGRFVVYMSFPSTTITTPANARRRYGAFDV